MELQDLFVYPLKSARGIRCEMAAVERRGLAGDRRWMLVDEAGRFVSQRSRPEMARLQMVPAEEGMWVQAPGAVSLLVPTPPDDRPRVRVTVWDDEVEAVEADPAASAWFSRYLKRDVCAVYMPGGARRAVDPKYGTSGDVVSFADGYPVLLVSQASVDALNERLVHPVSVKRFRPNVVVGGGTAFQEDGWSRIRIGDVTFRVVKPCARCAVVSTDQKTGRVGKEPLRTLARFRMRNGQVYFGQNVIPEREGTLRVGDEVEVLERAATR